MNERDRYPNLDPEVAIHHCTKISPMTIKKEDAVGLKQLWIHDDAEETPESMEIDGNTMWTYCPNCDNTFAHYLGD